MKMPSMLTLTVPVALLMLVASAGMVSSSLASGDETRPKDGHSSPTGIVFGRNARKAAR